METALLLVKLPPLVVPPPAVASVLVAVAAPNTLHSRPMFMIHSFILTKTDYQSVHAAYTCATIVTMTLIKFRLLTLSNLIT